jgi:hypothetical protein
VGVPWTAGATAHGDHVRIQPFAFYLGNDALDDGAGLVAGLEDANVGVEERIQAKITARGRRNVVLGKNENRLDPENAAGCCGLAQLISHRPR